MSRDTHNKYIEVQSLLKMIPNRVLYVGNIKNNRIYNPALNRAGLELANQSSCKFNKITSSILWGNGESNYLSSLSLREREVAVKNVFKLKPPLIILCDGFKHTALVEAIAIKFSTTVILTKLHSHQLYLSMAGWISEHLATYSLAHGTVIFWNGIGVLIQGESGVGKSEVALQLLRNSNAMFVGDDAIEITNVGGRIIARANNVASTFLEVRGIGVVNVAKMYGISKIKKRTTIHMVVKLVKAESLQREYFERLGKDQKYTDILGVKVPLYSIPVTYGRDISSMIEVAVNDYKLKSEGYNSASEYMTNYNRILKGKK